MTAEKLKTWEKQFAKANVWNKIKLIIQLSKDPCFWPSLKLALGVWRTHNIKAAKGYFIYSMICERKFE